MNIDVAAPTKAVAKKTEGALAKYEALSEPDVVADIIRDNLGETEIDEFALPQIKVPTGGGQNWAIETLDGEKNVKEIVGIIVAKRDVRAYWKDPMGGNAAPDCSSEDSKTGISDSMWSDDGGNGTHPCYDCEFAEWGSKRDASGKRVKGKACKQVARLFVLQEGAILPDVVNVPPSSLKGLRDYIVRIINAKARLHHVVTRLGLEKASSVEGIGYSRITFKAAAAIGVEEDRAIIDHYRAAIGTITEGRTQLITEDVAE